MKSVLTLLVLSFSLSPLANAQEAGPRGAETTVRIVKIAGSESGGIIGYDKDGAERVYVTELGKFVYDAPSGHWSFSKIRPGRAMNQLYDLMGTVGQAGCHLSVTVNVDRQEFVSALGNCDVRTGLQSDTNEAAETSVRAAN